MAQGEDHLDKETSISGELTPTGVKFGARSRFVAALDRLGGNLLEAANVSIEARNDRVRAVGEGNKRLIEAAVEYGVSQLGASPELAERAFAKHFRKVISAQENSDGVMREAVEDLRQNPPTDEQSADQSPLSEEFLSNMERYTEGASTEELRSRWGRVLAAEIRKPGTFSSKVLRVVDELDASVARSFEELCTKRLESALPFALVGEVQFATRAKLVASGLLVEPGLSGQIRRFSENSDNGGRKLWTLPAGKFMIALEQPLMNQLSGGDPMGKPLVIHEGTPAMPTYLLTDAGSALATILPNNEFIAAREYAAKLCDFIKQDVLFYAERGDEFVLLQRVTPPASPGPDNPN